MRAGRRILFGWKPDWEPVIQAHLDHAAFAGSFGRLEAPDLAAFDCVVPLTLADYAALAANPTRAAAAVLHPRPETVAVCDDKGAFAEFLIQNGFGALVPQTFAAGETASYPLVIKPRRGAWGEGVRVLRTPADDGLPAEHADLLRQAYVPGRVEHVAHMLAVNGRVVFSSVLECVAAHDFQVNGQGRAVTYRRTADTAGVLHLSAILRKLRYSGTACFDYKWWGGRPMVFELNPRVGFSLLPHDLNRYLDALRHAVR